MKGPRPCVRRAGGAAAAFLVAVVMSLAAGACSAPKPRPVDFSSAPHRYRSQDYGAVYERWTRHQMVVHQLELVLEIWATYKSWDYREAFVAHYSNIYGMGEEDRERLRTAQKEAAEGSYEFHITAQANNYKWNDLEKASSPWRLALVDGLGHEIYPEPIKVEKLPDLFEREFFPVKTPFTKTYSVRFTRPAADSRDFLGDQTGSIALRLSGPFGAAELLWSSR